jgi:hypothetical protein
MRQLQQVNAALDNCQQSKTEIRRLQAASRRNNTGFHRQQLERIEEQEIVIRETTARLGERDINRN